TLHLGPASRAMIPRTILARCAVGKRERKVGNQTIQGGQMSKSRSGHRGRAWKIGAAALAASGLALATAPAAGAAPTTPGHPTHVSITAGARNVKVTFTAPTSNGGSK